MTSYLPGRGDMMVMKLRGVQEEETAHYHPHPVSQNVLSTTKKQKNKLHYINSVLDPGNQLSLSKTLLLSTQNHLVLLVQENARQLKHKTADDIPTKPL